MSDLLLFGVVFLISFVGSMLQGSIGFGLGPFAVPLLVLIDPAFVPAPLLLVALVLTSLMFVRERSAVRFEEFSFAAIGRIIGSIIGAYFLTIFPAQHLKPLFAFLVIIAVILSVAGIKLALNRKNLISVGVVSGFMATVAAIGGAPMALVFQRESGPKIRGTLAAIFILGTIVSLASLAIVGKFTLADVHRALWLLPGVLLGFFFSNKTARIFDRGYLRPAILTLTTLAAMAIIFDQWFLNR
ncbi:sulfite exporter TauE/SafE family protein [Caldithrix abyssi]